uniref:Bee-milk protein n=1 Tax=Glossina brevipalpis TaxID=37001 RepID=A0A1A9WYD3_9MUSC
MIPICLLACWLISNSKAYDIFYNFELETTAHLQPLPFNLQNPKTLETTSRSQNVYTKAQQPFEIVNEWRKLDFEYNTYEQRQKAIMNREFIVENNLPLGIDIYENRIFMTTPRWKDGVPASLGTIPFPPVEISPAIKPYPNWEAHSSVYTPDCSKLISVYRTYIDVCQRLWLIDAGIVNATIKLNQICLPKIVAYDLKTDQRLFSYELPSDQVKGDSLHSNIVVNVASDNCEDAYAYVTDVWRFGIVVYSLSKNRSWRVTNFNFYPNPVASDFQIYGLNFQWLDGVFGMSLSSPSIATMEQFLYFHPMASFKEFMVSTALLHDESIWLNQVQEVAKAFIEIGDRGPNSQSSTSGITRDGVMFFTQVHLDGIACWDTAKSYNTNNLQKFFYVKDNNDSLIQFPNDLKVDRNPAAQSVWIISNRLPIFLYSQLDYEDINFRILRANANDLIKDTICDPLQEATNFISPQGSNAHRCD